MKEIEKMELTELSSEDSQKLNGEWWLAGLAVAGAVIYLYNNGPDFIKGIKEGFNDQQS